LVDTTFSKTANVCFININEILYSFLEDWWQINILKVLICHQD
jgi:hypothetical protein